MRFWLMKSEPGVYSIDDLARDGKTSWEGVRNYQARNLMRDEMQVGDLVLFYHSNAEPPGVAGVARIARTAYPDSTALDPNHPYFDPKATPDNPIWLMVDIAFVAKFPRYVSLGELKSDPALVHMPVLRRGMRLSVQPVEPDHFEQVQRMGAWTC
ncbi:EVE domain-containing protein [Anthocerotibacter panamensis]|uniref:EVE domain-containing protein n=1 Tax=Anthocerotibacter panamensis TaxID=2857077 RepID=UPI001C402E56|nr:EVE domain-containing protein [Anthocerotibacter panamensis]